MQYYVYGPWAIFFRGRYPYIMVHKKNCSRAVRLILPRMKDPFHLNNNLQTNFWYTPLLPKGHFGPLGTGLYISFHWISASLTWVSWESNSAAFQVKHSSGHAGTISDLLHSLIIYLLALLRPSIHTVATFDKQRWPTASWISRCPQIRTNDTEWLVLNAISR